MTEKAEVILFGADEIQHYWPAIEAALKEQPELWDTTYTTELIKERALNGHLQVWAVAVENSINILFMTQAYSTAQTHILQIWWMWGEGLVPALECIDAAMDRFAKKIGCKLLEVVGRRGLERVLKPLGAKFSYVTLMRPVRELEEN